MQRFDSAGSFYYVNDGVGPGSPVISDGMSVFSDGNSMRTGSTSTYFAGDLLGSIEDISESSGPAAHVIEYDPFGVVTAGSQSSLPSVYGYAAAGGAQTSPDSGLILMGSRWYDPQIGRFLTRDPSGAGDNPYAYCGNNPVSNLDPLGLQSTSGDGDSDPPFSITVSSGSDFGDPVSLVGATGSSNGGGSPSKPKQGPALSYIPASSTYGIAGFARGDGPNIWANNAANQYSFYQAPFDFGLGALTDLAYANPGESLAVFSLVLPGGLLADMVIGEEAAGLSLLEGGGCFVAGTPVQMADGTTKPIEEIQVGDQVLSRDQFASPEGKIIGKRVEKTVVHRVSHTVLLTLSSGEQIVTTEIHPFYVAGVGFVPAGQLCIGNLVVPRAGPSIAITSIERKAGSTTVYNFSVEDFHTYFVGNTQSGIWVHNQELCFGDNALLQRHFGDHGADFGATSAAEYEQMASDFMTDPATLMKVRWDGSMVFFDRSTEAFGVLSPENRIQSFYVPNPAIHGYRTNFDYFNDQH